MRFNAAYLGWKHSLGILKDEFLATFKHCPECGKAHFFPDIPRWDEDKVAKMLNLVNDQHCPRCGKRK